jgi:molybdopterin synthase sulfur carrier subunit
MTVTVKLPTQLRDAAGGVTSIAVDGGTVGEALDALYDQHGELRERIADGDGSLRRFVNVYLKGEDIRFLEGLDTAVADGDEVTILPAVAGGA